jgi:hypothetical protein
MARASVGGCAHARGTVAVSSKPSGWVTVADRRTRKDPERLDQAALLNTVPKVSGRHLELAAMAAEAYQQEVRDAVAAGALGFYARLFVQAGMPHSDPHTPQHVRSNGALTLTMMAPPVVGLPYGSLPRLLLSWVTTEAVRHKQRHLVLGNTLRAFMNQLGLNPSGGRRGDITRLRNQMRRLFASSINCTYEGPSGWAMANVHVADRAELWWDPKQPDQTDLWDSTVTLGERFFEELVRRPVPIDTRALRALTRSPLAIDLYVWLTYRMSYLHAPVLVPWELLSLQTGAHYRQVRQFRYHVLRALPKVAAVYPEASVRPAFDDQGQPLGLQLEPSPTHVRRRLR